MHMNDDGVHTFHNLRMLVLLSQDGLAPGVIMPYIRMLFIDVTAHALMLVFFLILYIPCCGRDLLCESIKPPERVLTAGRVRQCAEIFRVFVSSQMPLHVLVCWKSLVIFSLRYLAGRVRAKVPVLGVVSSSACAGVLADAFGNKTPGYFLLLARFQSCWQDVGFISSLIFPPRLK